MISFNDAEHRVMKDDDAPAMITATSEKMVADKRFSSTSTDDDGEKALEDEGSQKVTADE
jgi:hypothetical protein